MNIKYFLTNQAKKVFCVVLLFFSFAVCSLNVLASQDIQETESEKPVDFVCLDISDGDIFISETGYRTGDAEEETEFSGVYKISGSVEEAYGVYIESGEHRIIFDRVSIDQRLLKDCCPLTIEDGCSVDLYLDGENTLYAGAGCDGIHLGKEAVLHIHGTNQGSLRVMGNPKLTGRRLTGDCAVRLLEDSKMIFPELVKEDDVLHIYAGVHRQDYKEVSEYNNQPYLRIDYEISHECKHFSKEADCITAQYCLECGREVHPIKSHIKVCEATCTQDALCANCGEVIEKALGHQGVWKKQYAFGRYTETMVCTCCGETVIRSK